MRAHVLAGMGLLVTFGTGSAPFLDGRLVPNADLGYIEIREMSLRGAPPTALVSVKA